MSFKSLFPGVAVVTGAGGTGMFSECGGSIFIVH